MTRYDEDKCMKDRDEDGGFGRTSGYQPAGPPLDLAKVKIPTGGSGVQGGPYRGIEGETFSREWNGIGNDCDRLRVYGGWLVRYAYKGGLCFIPDHDGRWVLP